MEIVKAADAREAKRFSPRLTPPSPDLQEVHQPDAVFEPNTWNGMSSLMQGPSHLVREAMFCHMRIGYQMRGGEGGAKRGKEIGEEENLRALVALRKAGRPPTLLALDHSG